MTIEVQAISTLLKNARKAQGLTVKAVAQDICVQSGYLQAIEDGEYEKLPATTFAVGFVRSYAKALGEDADAIVAAFKQEQGIKQPAAPVVPASQKTTTKTRKVSNWLTPVAGLVGASMCWVVLGGSLTGPSVNQDIVRQIAAEEAQLASLQKDITVADPEVVATEAVLERGNADSAVKAAKQSSSLFLPAAYAAPQETSVSPSGIMLEAEEDSWVRVARADGTEVWSGILRAGQQYRPASAGDMFLTTSNAGGLLVRHGSNGISQLGDRGEIVSDFALERVNHLSDSSSAQSDFGSR